MKIQFVEVGHREYEFIFKTEEDDGDVRRLVGGAFLAALSHQISYSAGDKLFVTLVRHGEKTWAGERVTELILRLRC